MGVYDNQVAMAKRLISSKGQSVTWRSVTNGTPTDPTKPWLPSASSNTDNTVDIVFLPSNADTLRYLNGTEVPEIDEIGLMGQVSFTPRLKDVVIRGTQQLTIEAISTLHPNGEEILYTIGFKA